METTPVPLPSGRFTIGKTFDFEAGHRLASLPPEHKCSRQHGHTYQVEVVLSASSLQGPGFVTDFGDLAPFKRYLDSELDHRNLHEVFAFEPTSELLAQYLAGWFLANMPPGIAGQLAAVRVRETQRSWARFDVATP
ncbi:6-pyruvoyl tetrahydropterin synthase family protein [Streptomyces sp. NPDC001744]|uniref:6-pyruvoyl trahydropterin synthase family protein n=1 Tax=Streptomyces sp. NPDC001744 TaxID=3364606 RepID=UPI0036BAF359